MAERYEKLFSSYDKYCSVGSPALIVAEAILKDTKEDKVKAQLKFQNITNKTIKAVNIRIKAYDSFGRELQGIEEYQYADLCVFQGEYWGQDKAVTLPNELTRTIKVGILSVVFQDDTIWEAESDVWNKLSEPKKLYSLLSNDELVKQYKLEYGESAEYVYLEEEGIWHCTCGTINQISAEKCYHCRASKDAILSCDLDVLKANADARVAKEKAEAEERARIKAEEEEKARIIEKERLEREAKKKKKRNKILMITIPIAVVVITLIALTPNVIKPAIENAIAYNKASKLLEEGLFDDAQIAFQEIGDYKDSAEQALEAVYQKATLQLINNQFSDATNTFNSISQYKDAGEKALEAKYQMAELLLTEKKYDEAINVWTILGDYSDSKERVSMIVEKKKEDEYQEALTLMEEQKYTEAAEKFKELGDYKDSLEIVSECEELQKEIKYQKACSLGADGEYIRAIEHFKQLNGYKDSDELIISLSYKYACELYEEGNYAAAISNFEKASGYEDADTKLLDVKYEYAVLYMDTNTNNIYEILKELVELNYPGAKEHYDILNQRRVSVTFYKTPSSHTPNTAVESIGKGKYLSVDIELVMGTYGEKLPVVLYITYPNGEKEIFDFGWAEGAGIHQYIMEEYTLTCGKEWENGISSKGTLTIIVEDGKGNTVGSGSIKITD